LIEKDILNKEVNRNKKSLRYYCVNKGAFQQRGIMKKVMMKSRWKKGPRLIPEDYRLLLEVPQDIMECNICELIKLIQITKGNHFKSSFVI